MASSARIDELKKKFDENPRRYFAPLANEYRKAGDLEQAIAICRQHLADQPGNMSGHIVYGQALFDARQFDDAKVVFEAALALDPENLIALHHLGDIARDSGDFAASRQWYQRVLDADPRNEDIAAQLALVDEAMAQAASRVPDAIVTASVTPVVTPAESPVVGDKPGRPDLQEAATLRMRAVPDPRLTQAPEPEPEPEPAPPLGVDDVAVPRMSLMGLDLDAMAKVADTEETPSPAAGDFETSTTFDRSRFDPDIEVEMNPLAGLAGVPERDESSAGSLLAPPAADMGFELSAAFDATSDDEPRTEQLPPELQMPAGVTRPPVDLELPAPVFETTGLWDTPADRAAGAAAPPPPPPDASEPESTSLPMIELEELLPPPPPPPPITRDAVAPTPAGSAAFVTETMAELYLNQGLPDQALDVYRQLLAQRPGDSLLAARITYLEAAVRPTPTVPTDAVAAAAPTATPSVARTVAAPSGVSTRAFFGALARWRPGAGGALADAGAPPGPPATVSAVAGAPMAVAVSGPWATGAPFDLGLFAGSQIADSDEQAARLVASLYPEPIAATANDRASSAADATAPPTATPEEAVPMPGQPARTASTELSLDQVFPEPTAARPPRRTSSSFAFDQFFAEAPPPPAPRMSRMTPVQPAAAAQTPEEIEQFQTWLQGLKKK